MRTFVGAAALLLLFPLLAVVLAAPLPSGRSQSTTYQHPTLAPTDRARPSTTPPAFAIVTVLDDADPDPGVLFGVVALGGSLRRFRAAHSPVALVALVHANASADGLGAFARLHTVLLSCIDCLAILALFLLLLVMRGPRDLVVRRLRENVEPLPQPVAAKLARGESLDGLSNPVDGDTSFCVRCCVWRTHPMVSPSLLCCFDCERHPHHCRVCGRCVDGFDHHCGVFGRCIANKNMPFFAMLVGLGYAGFISTVVITSYD